MKPFAFNAESCWSSVFFRISSISAIFRIEIFGFPFKMSQIRHCSSGARFSSSSADSPCRISSIGISRISLSGVNYTKLPRSADTTPKPLPEVPHPAHATIRDLFIMPYKSQQQLSNLPEIPHLTTSKNETGLTIQESTFQNVGHYEIGRSQPPFRDIRIFLSLPHR